MGQEGWAGAWCGAGVACSHSGGGGAEAKATPVLKPNRNGAAVDFRATWAPAAAFAPEQSEEGHGRGLLWAFTHPPVDAEPAACFFFYAARIVDHQQQELLSPPPPSQPFI